MEWKNLANTLAFSLALTSAAAGLFPGSARAARDLAPTIVTVTDVSLSASVQATLSNDRTLPLADIFVSAKDGMVVLTGFVRSDSERSRAIKDAKSVPGVKTLRDNITVMPSDY
jgi:hyperosmotically inducible periplasmic protein